MTNEEKLEITNKFVKAIKLLNDLFEQADQDTPQDCRTRHFRDTMEEVEDFLVETGQRQYV